MTEPKHVTLLTTGGTIDKVYSLDGELVIGDPAACEILEAVVLLAASPILEEYFFRGVLYGRCKELVSAPAAAFMTAAFFGVFHWDLVQGIYSFFMGLILAYLMEKTNTVKAPVVFHFAANLAALVLEFF